MDSTGDHPLPPSAFLLRRSTPISEIQTPQEFSQTNFQNISADMNLFSESVSHQAAPLSSHLAVTKSQLHNLEKQLQLIKQENVELVRARDEARRQVQHLRAYYTDYMEQNATQKNYEKPRSTEDATYSSERCELMAKIDFLTKENAQLKSELQLSVLRAGSLETALKLQDKKAIVVACNNVTEQEKIKSITKFWRDHVLRLLVQLEQTKVEQEHANGRMQRERAQWIRDRDGFSIELETMRLKLHATGASLISAKDRIDLLQSELQHESERVNAMKMEKVDEHAKLCTALNKMRNALMELIDQITGVNQKNDVQEIGRRITSIPQMLRKLRQLERRLEFANNRLPILRTQLAVRDSASKDHCDGWSQTVVRCETNASAITPMELTELLADTEMEMKRCITERDSALRKLEQNAKSFNERVQSAQDEVRAEVANLRELVNVLENNLKEKEAELESCELQLANLKIDHENLGQQAASEQAQLRAQLSEAQIQVTKATVELKRAERRVECEVEERNARIAEIEKSYESKVKTLEEALRSFEPSSYAWYSASDSKDLNTVHDSNADQDPKSPENPIKLETLLSSINQLSHIAECLKSIDASSDFEGEQTEKSSGPVH